jgi:hypothetical protein
VLGQCRYAVECNAEEGQLESLRLQDVIMVWKNGIHFEQMYQALGGTKAKSH